MNFTIYTKPDCAVCEKAKRVLDSLGIQYAVREIAGLRASFDNIGEFSWLDGDPDHLPLVIAHGAQVEDVKWKWTGRDVADPQRSWTEQVKAFLALEDK